ncbi:MAG TPA: efflux RND transporter periplasmic adaptor subunit [Candidatus Acidoferrum sp.]|nr:efflux RND transporter periplasmic adaptor subunit [Candidatus Acidoferrum sp.]
MSRIFEALTVAHDPVVDKVESLSPGREEEPTEGSSELLPTVFLHSNADVFGRLQDHTAQPPGRLNWSHKRIRNYLILACFVTGLVLLGVNHAFLPHGSAFASNQSIHGVVFEGAVRPSSEVEITAESTGTVSDITVKVGDIVQPGQQLLHMDDREAQLGVKQARVELEAAQTKLDKFRGQLADADARVAISQRQEQLVPTRQWRDSPERAAAAYDQAQLNYSRSKKLFEEGLIAQQELDVRGTELRMARDDLENAKQLAAVSAKLAHDQADQANLQAKVTREEAQAQLREAEVNYERAEQQADATVVRATTAGVVSAIPIRLGDRVPGGVVLARLAKLDRMIAEIHVAAQMISELRVGQPAQVSLPSLPARQVEGRIRAINPLPAQNMTHLVEVEFDNPTLLLVAGQPAEVRFVRP